MTMLNRSLLLLRPLQPFLDWALLDDDDGLASDVFEGMRKDPQAYLVRPCEDLDELEELVAESWPIFFEYMLEAWSTDEATWPVDRTLAMFQSWFEVIVSSVVDDTAEGLPFLEE